MIVKVKFEGTKPEVWDGLRVGKNGRVRMATWRKLIIGHRLPDSTPTVPSPLEADEILMKPLLPYGILIIEKMQKPFPLAKEVSETKDENKISVIKQAIDTYERNRYAPTETRMNAKTYADLISEHGNLLCSVIQTPIIIDNNVPDNSVWIF